MNQLIYPEYKYGINGIGLVDHIIDNQTTDSSNETDLTIIHRKLGILLSTERPNDALSFLSSEDEEQIIAQYHCYSTLGDWKKAKSCSDKLLDSNSKKFSVELLIISYIE